MVFLLIVAAGCGDEADAQLSTFSYAELTDPTSLDPAAADEAVGLNILRYLFDGLVTYDSATGEVKPAVAERWDISDDATVFTFHLKKGVKFTNGREVKAGDFVYSWTRALSPDFAEGFGSSILSPIQGSTALTEGQSKTLAGVEAVDDYTLKVTLDFPLAEFVTFLGHPVAVALPQEEVEKVDFKESPVGNGAFKLKEKRANEQIVLEKNSDYYGEAAKVDQVTVKIIPSEATAVSELKAGNVDAVKRIPPGQLESLRGDSSVRLFEGPANEMTFVGFNLSVEPWKGNDKLRQALNWAVDRETLASKVLQGTAAPADGIVPTSMSGHQTEAMPYEYDTAKAKALLAEAGYPDGNGLPPIKLAYRTEGPAADIAQALQANFKAIGVDVELDGMESGVFLDKMGEHPFFLISWQADYNSLDTFLFPLFRSDGGMNVFGYASSDVDANLDKARSTLDADARTKAYNDAERMIMADAPIIPLIFRQDVMLYSTNVTNFVHTPLGDLALSEITVSEK